MPYVFNLYETMVSRFPGKTVSTKGKFCFSQAKNFLVPSLLQLLALVVLVPYVLFYMRLWSLDFLVKSFILKANSASHKPNISLLLKVSFPIFPGGKIITFLLVKKLIYWLSASLIALFLL